MALYPPPEPGTGRLLSYCIVELVYQTSYGMLSFATSWPAWLWRRRYVYLGTYPMATQDDSGSHHGMSGYIQVVSQCFLVLATFPDLTFCIVTSLSTGALFTHFSGIFLMCSRCFPDQVRKKLTLSWDFARTFAPAVSYDHFIFLFPYFPYFLQVCPVKRLRTGYLSRYTLTLRVSSSRWVYVVEDQLGGVGEYACRGAHFLNAVDERSMFPFQLLRDYCRMVGGWVVTVKSLHRVKINRAWEMMQRHKHS